MSSELAAAALALWACLAAAESSPEVAGPDVAIHVLEPRPFPDQGAREVALYPLVPQVNGRYTGHLGTVGAFTWHLQENFGLQLTAGGNWLTGESAYNADLATRAQVSAPASSSLLLTWALLGGVELSPASGKFAWFDGEVVHFSLVLSGGAGAGGTRHQLRPVTARVDGTVSPATFGDTGVKFLGSVGLGLRVRLGARFALRLEVKDVVYTARVEQVNGCGLADLANLDARTRASLPLEGTPVAPGCDLRAFLGRAPGGDSRSLDLPLAYQLVRGEEGVPSSDVLHNVGAYLGLAFLF
jgi:outer membrane beta-barrel protein